MINLPRISRNYKILFGAIIVITAIAFLSLKTNLPKKLLNYINKDLIAEKEAIEKEKEELINQMVQDSIDFQEALDQKAIEVEAFRFKYNNSLQKIRRYEQALNDYRVGNYPTNFRKFTRNVTNIDTLSLDGFNVDSQD